MSYIIRGITKNQNARFFCINSLDIVAKAQEIHKCSSTSIAALGRLLTAGAMMGADLKGSANLLTLKIDSPKSLIKTILVTADNKGNVKGYVGNPLADLPLNPNTKKLDVGGIVGQGELRVIKDLGLKEPYVGISPIITGEIGDDLAYYFYNSEQIPSIVGVGVLVNQDLSIKQAGGFIIQLLPDATEEFITKLEEKLPSLTSVTELLDKGYTPEDIIKYIFEDVEEFQIMEKNEVKYSCNCDRERYYKALITLGKEELEHLFEKEDTFTTECHFCEKRYVFSKEDFKEI